MRGQLPRKAHVSFLQIAVCSRLEVQVKTRKPELP